MVNFNLSKHFTYHEMCVTRTSFDNQCVNPLYITNLVRLCDVLEVIRDAVGKPLHVNSAYRSPRVNRAVGGVSTSDHLYGFAADIYVDNLSSLDLYNLIKSVHTMVDIDFGQVIRYKNFVHVSINTEKHKNEFFEKL
ncbi:MAG: D-Ala-D-Ala carboxypeptidase family metallohydrolase [Segatella oris]|uniref:D-Ala-D-Ala carboxypeptidase family metallohydrolase n=1 Tax=Segatella oris TaxID=28135 RepID=UPI003FA2E14A